jgi:TRAP-type C4-dicarboxylate transport system permease small subunit
VKTARNVAIIAVVAAAVAIIPSGRPAVNVLLTIIGIAFFGAIAFLGYRLYMENRFTLDSLGDRERIVLYVSLAVALLGFAAANRWGVLVFIALLALASYGVFWVIVQYRRYD